MKLSRSLAATAGLSLLLAGAAACDTESASESTAAAGASAPAKQLTFGLANQQESVTFPAALAKGAKAKADELGIKLVTLDSQGDQQKQASQMQDLIAQKVDGILLVPLSPGPGQALVDQAAAANIPVGTVHGYVGANRDIESPYDKLKFIVTENERGAGQTAGDMAVKEVPGGKVAVITGAPGFDENTTRVEKFKAALDAKGGYQIVATQPGGWTKQDGQSACQNILAATPDLALIYAISDDMAVGCAAAVKSANSKAKIIGVGGSEAGIAAVKDGTLVGTVCYKPYDSGEMAVQLLHDAVTGKLSGAPKTTFYDTPGVTKANVDSCTPQW
jgi:ribose transport system substrate-binding protein